MVTTAEGTVSGSPLSILEAKVAPPRVRGSLVTRERLDRLLDSAATAPLTLISAPTGYGKTTATRTWLLRSQIPNAWVTLDIGDNDPIRLWTYVAEAVNRVRRGAAQRTLHLLSSSQGDPRSALDALGDALTGPPFVLVLDDLQAITDQATIDSLEYFIRTLRGQARVVAVTRTDPPLPFALMRSRGHLAEIRVGQLAFTRDEAHEMLVDAEGLDLVTGEVDQLVERTEGWPAGLYLAALWLQGKTNPASEIAQFAGDHRHVAAYLSGEVLDGLTDDLRDFLIRSAALGRFTAELCDFALDRRDSAERLAQLESANLFLVSLDGSARWFRYHSLFEELLLLELSAVEPGAAAVIRRRASTWCYEQGLAAEAGHHAATAGDHHRVADLLLEHHILMFDNGLMATVLRWIQGLPPEVLREKPLLTAVAAVSAGVTRQAGDRARFVALAEELRAAPDSAWDPYCEAMLGLVHAALVLGSVEEAVSWGRRATELARAGADDLLSASASVYSLALFYAGDDRQAVAAAQLALEHHRTRALPPRLIALAVLAMAETARGRLETGREAALSAQSMCREAGLTDSWLGALVAGALGTVHEAEGRFSEADKDYARAARLHVNASAAGRAWANVCLARVRARRGHLDDAQQNLDDADEILAGLADSGRLRKMRVDVQTIVDEAVERARAGELVDAPSDSELAVLQLLDGELTLRQIGERLYVSKNTVKSHTQALYRKLRVSSRQEAVARARALGLLAPDSPG
jgi:LuxR family transcriptional regulator, maltose regulon positive regulatory protein